jgi:hypothetical protein
MYVFLTLFIFLFLFLRFCYKNIELIVYIPSLAHNPPPPSKISATSHQRTLLVAQEHQGHKLPRHRGDGGAGANTDQQANTDVSVPEEACMPPKICKKWMHHELEAACGRRA